MKRTGILFIFLAFGLSTHTYTSEISNQARAWAHAVAHYAGPDEMQILANLVYWSFYRSHTTLNAQKLFLRDQQVSRNAGHAIAQTRRNPSTKNVSPINPEELRVSREEFTYAVLEYQKTGAIYAQCVESIIHGTIMRSSPVQAAIETMRTGARAVVAQSLLAATAELQQTLLTTQNLMAAANALFNQQALGSKSTKFLYYLWDYLPQLMVKSFVRFDTEYIKLSENCWQALFKSEEFSNQLWEIIEVPRAAFYAEYYAALYELMQERSYAPSTYMIMFDQHGYMPVHKRTEYLPYACL